MQTKLLMLVVFLALSSVAITPSVHANDVGIGRFMQKQLLVKKFMGFVGWNDQTEYEETGLKMRDLLLSLVTKDKEARQWIEKVNVYFNSDEFKKQSADLKKQEIFEAKVYSKMWIHDVVINNGKKRSR